MIRVIYRWRVKPAKEQAFRGAWESGTTAIRRTFKASHGSMLLQGKEDPSEFLGIAAWDDVLQWRSAHKSPQWPPDPQAAQTVRVTAGKTISTQVFDEVCDLTTMSERWAPYIAAKAEGLS